MFTKEMSGALGPFNLSEIRHSSLLQVVLSMKYPIFHLYISQTLASKRGFLKEKIHVACACIGTRLHEHTERGGLEARDSEIIRQM